MKTEAQKKIDYFKQRVHHYFFDVFHLHQFQLSIESQNKHDARASCYWHPIEDGAQMIFIRYSIQWIEDKNTTYDEIDKTAFHEVIEALLSEMNELATYRYLTEKDIVVASHRVIRTLENTIFQYICDPKYK